jgi:protein phosphatase
MTINYKTFTVCGKSRANNEDCLLALPEAGLFMISDGMGGHLAGEVASRLAVDAVAQYLADSENSGKAPDIRLEEAISYANSQIYEDSRNSEEHFNMGATAAIVWQLGDRLYIAHVGDSRVYVFNREHARQLTQDHSLVGEMLREGSISPSEALKHPKKNVLTRALGVEESVQPDISVFELPIPGNLLICTDGLSSYLPMETVLPQVAAMVSREQALPVLAELAKEAGSTDDITCILLWEEKENRKEEGSANG